MKTLRTLLAIGGLLVVCGQCKAEEQAGGGLPAASIDEARAAAEGVAAAVSAYRDCRGELPRSLVDLTTTTSVSGVPCGPMRDSLPTPLPGWMAFLYQVWGDGTFRILLYSDNGGQTIETPSR
jgi:hypothetical protein